MLINNMFSSNKLLEKALDASLLKNEAISSNLANVDTPGYKRKDVNFKECLKNASNSNSIEPKIVTDKENLKYRHDGNNVDVDTEMSEMAKNTIRYNVLISQLNNKLKRMKMSIKG